MRLAWMRVLGGVEYLEEAATALVSAMAAPSS